MQSGRHYTGAERRSHFDEKGQEDRPVISLRSAQSAPTGEGRIQGILSKRPEIVVNKTTKGELARFSFSFGHTDKLFWVLLVVFIAVPLLYFSYVPIWDGWEFSRCYLNAAINGSLWCHDHSAFLHTFLFGLTQRVDPGSFKLIYTLNILLGILGLIGLRSLLQYLFGGRLSFANLTLVTFCFGLNPIFLVHVIQPSLDYTLPIFLVIQLLFMFKKQFFYAASVGILMVFTKESGFMLYGVSVFLFIPLLVISDPPLRKDKRKLAGNVSVLVTPVLLFCSIYASSPLYSSRCFLDRRYKKDVPLLPLDQTDDGSANFTLRAQF